ncbi:putative reverse transcriptase domain-containing protein [Tanacetum coccineum]
MSRKVRWQRNKPSVRYTWEYLKIKFPSKYCPHARTAKKIEEINNFQQDPEESLFQDWVRFNELLMKSSTLFNRDAGAIQAQLNNLGREIMKVNEKVYDAQVGCEQCKGGGYRSTGIKDFYKRNQCKPFVPRTKAIYGRNPKQIYGESVKRHEVNSNLMKVIRASTDAAIRNQGASIKTLEIQIGQMSKVLQARGFGSLPSSTENNLRDHVKSISTIVEADQLE